MELEGTVLLYNAIEARDAGLPRERVVGRQFLRDLTPCSNCACSSLPWGWRMLLVHWT